MVKPRTNIICSHCKKTFYVLPSGIKRKYCSQACYGLSQIGRKASPEARAKMGKSRLGNKNNFNGFKFTSSGYKIIVKHDHPFSDSRGYVQESRLVAEKALGRYLDPTEKVHHIDLNPLNNDIANLFVFESQGEHLRYHRLMIHNPFLKTWLESNIIDQPSYPFFQA